MDELNRTNMFWNWESFKILFPDSDRLLHRDLFYTAHATWVIQILNIHMECFKIQNPKKVFTVWVTSLTTSKLSVNIECAYFDKFRLNDEESWVYLFTIGWAYLALWEYCAPFGSVGRGLNWAKHGLIRGYQNSQLVIFVLITITVLRRNDYEKP